MRLTKSSMKYKNIIKKLRKGIGLADRETKISEVNRFNSDIERIAFTAARSTGQLEGFEIGFGADLVGQLKTGSLFPDEYMGWSTKTILVALLIALVLRVKKLKGTQN